MQIAFSCDSDRYDDGWLAFAAAACNAQAEGFCSDWKLPFVPVAFYRRGTVFPAGTTHAIIVVDDLGEPGMSGYHDFVDGVSRGRVKAQNEEDMLITLSHEVLELIGDPKCNVWLPRPAGGSVALEVSDPIEADAYDIPVAVLGETRSMKVSNYVLPSWFDREGVRPFDAMGLLTEPFQMRPGGYMLVRDELGVRPIFADDAMPQTFARKMANVQSRLIQRLRAA